MSAPGKLGCLIQPMDFLKLEESEKNRGFERFQERIANDIRTVNEFLTEALQPEYNHVAAGYINTFLKTVRERISLISAQSWANTLWSKQIMTTLQEQQGIAEARLIALEIEPKTTHPREMQVRRLLDWDAAIGEITTFSNGKTQK